MRFGNLYMFAISRRGGKQPFHRLFGCIVSVQVEVVVTMQLPARSNPVIDLIYKNAARLQHFYIWCA